jgi:imidazoleglycerol-phosphate dehydratase/histidinol-phosphatase
MKRVLFIDRDGTLIAEPDDFQVDSFEKLRLLPGVIGNLNRIARSGGYELVIVSNQDGLGTTAFPEERFHAVQDFLMQLLESEGIVFSDVLIDRSFEADGLPTRKPGTGMLGKYLDGSYDLARSYVIGDRPTDVQLAANLGASAIFLRNPHFDAPVEGGSIALIASGWSEIADFLTTRSRTSLRRRTTSETDVSIELALDGSARASISTGIPFFDHMLEQIPRHAGIDLTIRATGDLDVDQHHTIEDVAITLGEAFDEALADKRGIQRYGFMLPMDDCLAQVALDFGGRNWIVWDAEFNREMIGGMPTEMFFHFFKSFTDHARCNLNIKAEGVNEHHKIEAIFKAFARAIRMAVRRDGTSDAVPSSKGVL